MQTSIFPTILTQGPPSNTNGTVNYTGLFVGLGAWQSDESIVGSCIGCVGQITITKWRVETLNAPSPGNWTFTIRQKPLGGSVADTAATVNCSGASAPAGATWTGALVCNPGDMITVSSLPASSPVALPATFGIRWTVEWTCADNTTHVWTNMAGITLINASQTKMLSFQYGGTVNYVGDGTDVNEERPAASGFTIRVSYCNLNQDPTSGGAHPTDKITITLTVDKWNGSTYAGRVDTAFTYDVTAQSGSNSGSQTYHIDAGDVIAWKVTSTANIPASTHVFIGTELIPDVDGESFMFTEAQVGGTGFKYQWGIISSDTATEENAKVYMFACVMRKYFLRAYSNSTGWHTVGAGDTYSVSARLNKADSGSPSSPMIASQNNATVAQDTANSVTYADGQYATHKVTQTSGPGSTAIGRFGVVFYIPLTPPRSLGATGSGY